MSVRHGVIRSFDDYQLTCSEVQVGDRRLLFADSGRMSRKRVDTLFTKEPVTIDWLNKLTPEDRLLDVGANVGMYTVYAAVVRNCSVTAIEPEALNYAELTKNIILNDLDRSGRVEALCMGFDSTGEGPEVTEIFLGRFSPAYSHHDVGQNRWNESVQKVSGVDRPELRRRQRVIACDADYAIRNDWVLEPTHVKIDVDGGEYRVVAGMKDFISGGGVKSILMECDFSNPQTVETMKLITDKRYDVEVHQIGVGQSGLLSESVWRQYAEARHGMCNAVFTRK